jgi:uroporphyrinogen-III decarboxylase
MITGFLDKVMENKRILYNYCLEQELAEIYFMVGSELAAPPMFSEKTFQQWILPYSCQLTAMIHAHGGKVIQHFHGAMVKTLLPYFLEMGADALHTIEAPPVGNCTMAEAFEVVGDKMTLIGNIQYDDFRIFSKDEMRHAVTKLLHETNGKRFILSPSAGPYDADVSDAFLENYIVMLETAWNYNLH